MKKLFLLILIIIINISCLKQSESIKKIQKNINSKDLQEINNIYYFNNKKYSGKVNVFSDTDEKILISEYCLLNGILNGPLKSFNQDGFLQHIFYYKENYLLPIFKEFSSDFQLKSEIKQLKNNKIKVIFYQENKIPAMSYEAIFKFEKYITPSDIYDFKRKRLKKCIFYKDGILNIFNKKGEIKEKIIYKNDQIIKKIKFLN